MKLADQTDEELMTSLKAGNQDALTVLYNRYYTPLFNYLRVQIRQDRDAAEDVLQAVFLRIFNHAGEFEAGKLFRPWMYSIADRLGKNAKRDTFRRIQNNRSITDVGPSNGHRWGDHSNDFWLGWYASGGEAHAKLESSRHTDPEYQRQLDALPQIIMELPDELRQVVEFVATNGASLRSAEAILGIGRRTLSKRLKQAQDIIRERLDQTIEVTMTSTDVALSSLTSILNVLPDADCEALGRVILHEGHDLQDIKVLTSVLGKALGNVATQAQTV